MGYRRIGQVSCFALFAASAIGCALRWQVAMMDGAQSLYLGNDEGAHRHFGRALAIAESGGPDDPRIAPSLEALSAVHYQMGRPDRAEPLLHRALGLREARDGPDHPELVYALLGLYHIAALDRSHQEEAKGYLSRLESVHASAPDYEPGWREQRLLMALVIVQAGRARLLQGREEAADPLYRNALDRLHRLGRSTYGLELPAIEEYTELLRRQGRSEEVAQLHERFDYHADASEDYLSHSLADHRRTAPGIARWNRGEMPLRIHLPRPERGSCEDPDAVLDVARDAVLAWSDVVEPGIPSFQFVDAPGDAQIPIVWNRQHRGGPFGQATVRRRPGGRLSVDRIQMALRYDDGTEAPLDFLGLTLLHEMGHALGLGHSPYPTDIMCEPARGCLVGRIEGLSDRDRTTLQRLYGKRPEEAATTGP